MGTVRLGLAGDVMLGRLVDRYVLGNPAVPPAYAWGDLLPLFQRTDLRMINLECVIASSGMPWALTPKTFHFRARPRAIEALGEARVDFASLANNHILDFDVGAMNECLDLLDGAGIAHAGAGMSLADATAPAVLLAAGGLRCAVLALTDNMPEWAARADQPGINFIDVGSDGLKEPHLSRVRATLDTARRMADLVVVSAHIGPNWGLPSPAMRTLARQLVDLGTDLYWGHSNHTVQGIELHRGRPILYSCGDFLDDYAVDAVERNDLSGLFEIGVDDGVVREILLHPVRIDRLQVNRAAGPDASWICRRMAERCAALGTSSESDGQTLRILTRGSAAV